MDIIVVSFGNLQVLSIILSSLSMNTPDLRYITKVRLVVVIVVLLLLLPVLVAGVTHVDRISTAETTENRRSVPTEDITFVTTQGKEFGSGDAQLVAFDTSGSPVWVHDKYTRYYDIDPLGNGRILFVASAYGLEESNFTNNFIAVVMNWRTGEVYDRFKVPFDAHDVDYLGNGEYAIADKFNNRAYVYNRTRDQIVWEYKFKEHFPPYPIAGGDRTGYTHLNDIDAIDNGSAFLVSPRNFDRVMQINRSTKEVEWTLGEEDNYGILDEQHNPVVLSRDPLTVLVADSGNDRVVEYRRTADGWKRDWVYKGSLDWPRDADRLPNGNTLIVDSSGNRALEVTPEGEIVWEVSVGFGPYDIERPAYGDEPAGPTMHELGHAGTVVERTSEGTALPPPLERVVASFEFMYEMAQWVIPSWIGYFEFGSLLLVPLVVLGWSSVEIAHSSRLRSHIRRARPIAASVVSRTHIIRPILAGMCLLVGALLFVTSIAPRPNTTISLGISLLLLLEGVDLIQTELISERVGVTLARVLRIVRVALTLAAGLAVVLLVARAITISSAFTEVAAGLAVLITVSALRRLL